MSWAVEFDAGFRAEFRALDADVRKAIAAYATALASEGPRLGRPMADTLKGSKHANMKELRPTVNKVEWRVAYAFDTTRRAIVLAAAAKGGKASTLVYKRMIAKADARFAAHQAAVAAAAANGLPTDADADPARGSTPDGAGPGSKPVTRSTTKRPTGEKRRPKR